MPSSADYVNLITTTYNIPNSSSGSTQLRSAPLGFEFTGVYNYINGSLSNVGSNGNYWSRTAYSADYARTLYFNSGGVYPQHYGYRGHGFAVRCVAR